MKRKTAATLLAAGLIALSGCGGGAESGGGSSGASSASGSPGSAPGPEEPLRVVMQVQEYHENGVNPDGSIRPDRCVAEVPRLSGGEENDPEVQELNARLDELRRQWEEFKASPDHQEKGLGMDFKSYPFSNSKWVQVVVHTLSFPNYGSRGDMMSVNYDLQNRKAVPVEEALERTSLSGDDLIQRLRGEDLAEILKLPPGTEAVLTAMEVQAFRMREDGSAVFFRKTDVDVVGNEPTSNLLAYDSNEAAFSLYREKLTEGEEQPLAMDPPLQYGRKAQQ